jgi:hypothetical protein
MTAGRLPPKAPGFASLERGRTTGRGPCRTRWQGWRPRERTKSSKIGTSRHPANRKSVAATHSPGRIRSVCTIQAAARAADERDRRAPRAASRCHRNVAIDERPRPGNCGNTNHIQCVRLRPACSSASTAGKTGAWAVTKRLRSNGSLAVNLIPVACQSGNWKILAGSSQKSRSRRSRRVIAMT